MGPPPDCLHLWIVDPAATAGVGHAHSVQPIGPLRRHLEKAHQVEAKEMGLLPDKDGA